MRDIVIILLVNNALWMLFVWHLYKIRPRYNTKQGQMILEETEDINASAGTLKYHLERAEELELAASQHRREAIERADIMQIRANSAKEAIAK